MVTIDPADEAPEELTGAEFVEYMKNKKAVPTASVADEEEVEPIAKPAIKGKQVGEMQPSKGGKPAGKVIEWETHEGYDAGADSFEEKHPRLAKAVDIGKRVVGTINEKTAGYVKDTESVDRKLKELEKEKTEEKEEKKSYKKKSSKKSKGKMLDEEDFDFDNEDDEDITAIGKSTSKQKILPGNYKSAYAGGMGGGSYKSAYTGAGLGSGEYTPAYKTTVQTPALTQPARAPRIKESEVEEETPQARAPMPTKQIDRFNIQNWQSMGFPNTLPQSARGSLFRPAPPRPQPTVVPIVRQPYQPRVEQPTPRPPTRAPLSGPIPRIGFNFNTMPQIMKPRSTIAAPRAQAPAHVAKTIIPTAPTFFGVNLNEKKKPEPKPITNMGAGYKNVPLTVMDGLYPKAKYDPKKDPITKKSIIPKIQATITPNNFTMFGYKMKNRKL